MLPQQEPAFENANLQAEAKAQFDVLIEGPAAGRAKSRATPGVTKGAI